MSVLIIHQHFKWPNEGGALRSYFLAKALVDKGIHVQVLTTSNKEGYAVEHIEGIEIHYLPVEYANRFGFWKRVFSFLKFIVGCIRVGRKFADVKLCYAISVPLTVGLAARYLKWRYRIPFIFEVGDLWPDAAIELEVIKNGLLKKLLWRMERKIYSEAISVVALSPPIAEAIHKKVPDAKVHIFPNMADCEFFKPEIKEAKLEENFNVKGKLVVSYFGAMGFANGLENVLACAMECQKAKLPVHFFLAGDGAERENLISRAQVLQLRNLTFHSFQNRNGIHDLMKVTDIVFVSYRQARILETGSPNKFFDGLAAGKPIIINFGGWLRNEIEEGPCGFFVDPEDPSSIVQRLSQLLSQGQLLLYGQRARQLAEKKFSREKLTEQWTKIVMKEIQ
jgi:glycosyltransferase involved in cell wall biosynthesis